MPHRPGERATRWLEDRLIEVPTVLILGAGASMHVGYPLGEQLVSNLCQLRKTGLPADLPTGWSSAEVNHFLTRMSRSGHYSIDAFLETVPDMADLGKYLMAREMKSHENIDSLFPPSDSGWYQYLFNRLIEGAGAPGFESSELSVVTFNYDRSLEAYLHSALMARFDMPLAEASAFLSEIPIVHVHGTLGEYPDVPYESDCDVEQLLDISKQIKIIHEVSDKADGFCSPEFERAHDLLSGAHRIIFLGFGFHRDNIRRFRFFSGETTNGREMHATTSGIGDVERKALISRLEPLGFSAEMFNPHTCNKVFSRHVPL